MGNLQVRLTRIAEQERSGRQGGSSWGFSTLAEYSARSVQRWCSVAALFGSPSLGGNSRSCIASTSRILPGPGQCAAYPCPRRAGRHPDSHFRPRTLRAIKLNAVSGTMYRRRRRCGPYWPAAVPRISAMVTDAAVAVVPSLAPAHRVRISRTRSMRRMRPPPGSSGGPPAPRERATAEATPVCEDGAGQLQEIIVTATRRVKEDHLQGADQRIHAAITQTTIDTLGIKDFSDMAKYTPGVTVDTDRTNQISIRGIASSGGAATTGIYIDDTAVPDPEPISIRCPRRSISIVSKCCAGSARHLSSRSARTAGSRGRRRALHHHATERDQIRHLQP